MLTSDMSIKHNYQRFIVLKTKDGGAPRAIDRCMFELIIPYEKGQLAMSESEFLKAIQEHL